jgi:hypothetical protein
MIDPHVTADESGTGPGVSGPDSLITALTGDSGATQ